MSESANARYNLAPGNEILRLSPDMHYVASSAITMGNYLRDQRVAGLQAFGKADATEVSDAELAMNAWFNAQTRERDAAAAVQGEEISQAAAEEPDDPASKKTYILDVGDGSGELVATYRDKRTGNPISPLRPVPANAEPELIQEHERTTCTGLAMMIGARLQLAAAHNPFSGLLVIADRDLGGSFVVDATSIDAGGTANGRRLRVSDQPFTPSPPTWDRASWDGAPLDTSGLPAAAATPPLNRYSAIRQAVDVALGVSAAAAFAGNTMHDIAPAAAIVHGAGGLVMKPDGTLIDLDNLTQDQIDGGVLYTNVISGPAVVHAIQTGERSDAWLVDHAGKRFLVDWQDVWGGVGFNSQPEDLVTYEQVEGRVRTDEITVRPFGYQRGSFLTGSEIRQIKKTTGKLGASRWSYKNGMHVNGIMLVGTARIAQPDKPVTLGSGENRITVPSSDLILSALRLAVQAKLHAQAERLGLQPADQYSKT